jgi:GrpB-like predicted nucleotidyltransferase (UPF0157 family)
MEANVSLMVKKELKIANLEKYSFNKYSEKYKQLFNKEKRRLKKIFPLAKIEHVGSSAVEGLGGKCITDIAIAVSKGKIPNSIKKLETNGYEFRPNGGSEDRFFFRRIIRYDGKERRVHIHLAANKSNEWNSMLAVRDYLRENKEIADEYSELKKKAVIFAKGEGKRYRKYKKCFLKKIEKMALKTYQK